jgi:peptidoglycan/LPS O-acetylase OafA/YrhL
MFSRLMFDKSIDRAGYISFIKVIAICSIFLFHYGRFRSLWGFIDEDEVYFFYRHASDVWEFVYRATGYGNIGVGIFIFASGFGLCLSYLKIFQKKIYPHISFILAGDCSTVMPQRIQGDHLYHCQLVGLANIYSLLQ